MTLHTAPWHATLDKVLPVEACDTTTIPRILHQIYFPGFSQLPQNLTHGIDAIRALNPDWEYRFYDAEAGISFIREFYGEDVLATYLKIDPEYYAARADLLRYLLCYAHGGVYLDIKSDVQRPLSDVLKPDDTFLLSQWEDLKSPEAYQMGHPAAHAELRHIKGFEYVQWFIVCAPRHPFLKSVIDSVLNQIEHYNAFAMGVGRMGVLRLTGPIAYTLAIDPVRTSAAHRMVAFEEDLGFRYSVFGDHEGHRTAFGTHYSEKTLPVVESGQVATQAVQFWHGFVSPKWTRAKRILRRML